MRWTLPLLALTIGCTGSGTQKDTPGPPEGVESHESWTPDGLADGPLRWVVVLGGDAWDSVKASAAVLPNDVVYTVVRFADEAEMTEAVTPPTSDAEGTGGLLDTADWIRTTLRDAVSQEYALSSVLRDQVVVGTGLAGTGAALLGLRGDFANGVGCHVDLAHGGNPTLATAEILYSLDIPGGATVVYGEPYDDPDSLVPAVIGALHAQGPMELEPHRIFAVEHGEPHAACLLEGLAIALRGRTEPWGAQTRAWLAEPIDGEGCLGGGRLGLFASDDAERVRLAVAATPPPAWRTDTPASWSADIGDGAEVLVEALDVAIDQSCSESSFAADYPTPSNRVAHVTAGTLTAQVTALGEDGNTVGVSYTLTGGVLDTGWESVTLADVSIEGPVILDVPE